MRPPWMVEVLEMQEQFPVNKTDAMAVSDADQRRRALTAAESFIVQAPAGSGKTELLSQRYLLLLARVAQPEEVVAITFTNKAAAEMRSRVLQALHNAHGPMPTTPHQRVTWELAQAVVARDRELDWQMENNPGRLRIQTIDSLCTALTRQMPLLARFGAQPAIARDPEQLYRAAARATLAEIESGNHWSQAVECLLIHLDNNLGVVAGLLATMLARRDQWLRHVADPRSARIERATLEATLVQVVGEALTELAAVMPAEREQELVALARFAAGNLQTAGGEAASVACLDLTALPDGAPASLAAWCAIANLLLTKEGGWRKNVNIKNGFPAPSAIKDAAGKARLVEMKDRMGALLERLRDAEDLRSRLHAVRELPPLAYDEDQWAVLQALLALLPVAVAQLRLVFQEHGHVDFTEVAQAALWALGEPDNPTDLALALDYRVQHILVDEFQDTSLSQYELLERLTAGWVEGDGRTLFAVGDPMQSIYRFREAEVGLYLRARRAGIGGVRLTPLTLRVNFRSHAGIVQWVNASFARVLPAREDVTVGAVPYSASEAAQVQAPGVAVQLHALPADDGTLEAQEVIRLVQETRRESPASKVAILVRSRGHLAQIAPRLKSAGLRFRAIEIERLDQRQVVQDLLALTRALMHPADRTAWLACLRAPWCGLGLADLYVLAAHDIKGALWDSMQEATAVAALSMDGRQRLLRIRAVMHSALAQRRRRPLRAWVEGVWLALGGPACVPDETDLEDAQVFLDLLEQLDAGDLMDFTALAAGVVRLFALPDVEADDSQQLMTIHKAKGLEFDVVMVPGLGRTPRPPSPRLLIWQEIPRGRQVSDLLLAPIRRAGEHDDPIYRYAHRLDERKGRHEDGRVLYVAATRAKQRLHLLGQLKCLRTPEGLDIQPPPTTSLLAQLWPVVEAECAQQLHTWMQSVPISVSPSAATLSQTRQRLPTNWALPPPPAALVWSDESPRVEATHAAVEFVWAGETARLVGSVVHRYLLHIAGDGAQRWNPARVKAGLPSMRMALAHLGVPPSVLERAAQRVQEALLNTLEDARGRWILDATHSDARSEYALTGVVQKIVQNVIIDRTFVDAKGIRWIVDYKTSSHTGGGLEAFLDSERERYGAQLEHYARLMALMDMRPIRLGLYFPLLQGWREWGVP